VHKEQREENPCSRYAGNHCPNSLGWWWTTGAEVWRGRDMLLRRCASRRAHTVAPERCVRLEGGSSPVAAAHKEPTQSACGVLTDQARGLLRTMFVVVLPGVHPCLWHVAGRCRAW